jgi:fumarate reductase subunit C
VEAQVSRRPYVRPISTTGWWLSEGRYFRYMMRELSSLFIGAFAVLMIFGLYSLAEGQPEFESFVALLSGPAGTAFLFVTFLFSVYHTYTWFKVTPKAMPIVLAGKRVPGSIIVAAHWLVFAIVSAALWLMAVAN